MINDLTISNTLSSIIWKCSDDTTVSEIVPKSGASMLQDTVHDVLCWSNDNRFKLNSLKCKELRIDFRRESNLDTVSLKANGNAFEIVKSAKILGVTIRNDLKWDNHVDNITAKADRQIYLLKQLKRAGIDPNSILSRMHSFRPRMCMPGFPFQLASLFVRPNREGSEKTLKDSIHEVSYSKALEVESLKHSFIDAKNYVAL